MSNTIRRQFSAEFKAKVALEALKEQETLNVIAARHGILPVQVSQWKGQLLERLPATFHSRPDRAQADWEEREAELFRKIGQLEMELDWLKKKLPGSPAQRRAMIEPAHPQLSVRRQCRLLGLARSTAYHRPRGEPARNLALLRALDELYTQYPFFGVARMTVWLRREGWRVNPKRVRRLLRSLGLQALWPKRRLSQRDPRQAVFPYLLRDLPVQRPNQVWCSDITYIRLREGFAYLVAVMDWHSRRVLAWGLHNSLDAVFCVRALREALSVHGAPEIFNTDQGSQFTSAEFVGELQHRGIRVSMDGRGRALDNVFIERLWRSVKYEEVYLREYVSLVDAHAHLARYFDFYNFHRPHQGLGDLTPDEVYRSQPLITAVAG